MTARLRVAAGGHELLLDSGQVHRVWTVEALADETVAWEGRDVPLVDLAALLADAVLSDTRRAIVVYGDSARPIALAVDAVRGLVQLRADGVAALPPFSPAFALLFDGIAVEPVEGRYPLCLRSVLDPAALTAGMADRGGAAHG